MSLVTILYLIDFFGSINAVFLTTVIISVIALTISLIATLVYRDDLPLPCEAAEQFSYADKKAIINYKLACSSVKVFAVLFIISSIANAFIPSKSTMYLMVSAKYLTEGSVPLQVKEILDSKLSSILVETKEEAKKILKKLEDKDDS